MISGAGDESNFWDANAQDDLFTPGQVLVNGSDIIHEVPGAESGAPSSYS